MSQERPLRIAVLGNLDSIHTRRWLSAFVERGHEMHAISFYRPAAEVPDGVTLHVLAGSRGSPQVGSASGAGGIRRFVPASLLRLVHGVRYLRAGLRQTLREIAPDVLHTHYVVEYGFYGAVAGFSPTVVSAWGSDVYVAPRDPLTNLIARWTLQRANLVTANDAAMLTAARKLGAGGGKSILLRIGALEDLFFTDEPASANLSATDAPTVISTRALEPLYNVDIVLRAFARVRQHVPAARLIVANDGSERSELQRLAESLGLADAVQFVGRLPAAEVGAALSAAHVYVSVPSSDSMAASTLEAMARGCFPVVSDLPSQDGFIEHGSSGLRVSAGDTESLALALQRALVDADLRRSAVGLNRSRVESEARLSVQVERLEGALRELMRDSANL